MDLGAVLCRARSTNAGGARSSRGAVGRRQAVPTRPGRPVDAPTTVRRVRPQGRGRLVDALRERSGRTAALPVPWVGPLIRSAPPCRPDRRRRRLAVIVERPSTACPDLGAGRCRLLKDESPVGPRSATLRSSRLPAVPPRSGTQARRMRRIEYPERGSGSQRRPRWDRARRRFAADRRRGRDDCYEQKPTRGRRPRGRWPSSPNTRKRSNERRNQRSWVTASTVPSNR